MREHESVLHLASVQRCRPLHVVRKSQLLVDSGDLGHTLVLLWRHLLLLQLVHLLLLDRLHEGHRVWSLFCALLPIVLHLGLIEGGPAVH